MNGLATGSELPTNPHPTSLHEATFSHKCEKDSPRPSKPKLRPPIASSASAITRAEFWSRGGRGGRGQEFFMGGEGGLNKRERPAHVAIRRGIADENIGHAKTPTDALLYAFMRRGREFMRENARELSRRFWW